MHRLYVAGRTRLHCYFDVVAASFIFSIILLLYSFFYGPAVCACATSAASKSPRSAPSQYLFKDLFVLSPPASRLRVTTAASQQPPRTEVVRCNCKFAATSSIFKLCGTPCCFVPRPATLSHYPPLRHRFHRTRRVDGFLLLSSILFYYCYFNIYPRHSNVPWSRFTATWRNNRFCLNVFMIPPPSLSRLLQHGLSVRVFILWRTLCSIGEVV